MADARTQAPPGRRGEIPQAGGRDRGTRGDMDRTREVADDVRRQASSLLDEGRREGRQMLGQQKDAASEQVDAVAGALRSAADDLHRRDDDRAGRFVSYAADRLESFGQAVRDKDIDTLIEDAERLGRRSPAAFFAGTVALGFLLSRFLKSSRSSARHDGRTQRPQPDPAGQSFGPGEPATGTAPIGDPFEPATPFPPGATGRSDIDNRSALTKPGPMTEVPR